MSYDEFLADRITTYLEREHVPFEAKKMMGGLCYMVKGKMCLGIVKDDLMARIDPDVYEEALQKPGCREMDFTHRPMKGFVFVSPEAIDDDEGLAYWINLALDFNERAKASKKKK